MKGFRLVKNGSRRKMEIDPRKKYRILSEVSHVYVRAGEISFFASINGEIGNIKTKRGTFLSVPLWAKFVEFPDYYKNPGGHFYGEPRWYAVKTC
ncbi:hypothetical protein KJ639_00570 [Patescibacteria group bacterium]|nr:hypothetical protein [Patescibacteria group bacterium]